MDLSPAELYAIAFQNPEPKYFSRIPHILDHLTYDSVDEKTGRKEVKRLSVYAIQLYRTIKSISGDYGACWQNRDKIAHLANMSAGSISNAKKELQQGFHQLDGNPLIKIESIKKKTEKYGAEYHKIIILDIWRWNNAFMATKKFHKDEGPSPDDIAGEGPSPDDIASPGAPSPHDTNKNKHNKNPMFKEQQPVADATSVCSLEKKSSVLSKAKTVPPDKLSLFNWLMKIGCDELGAFAFMAKFSEKDISLASGYLQKQIENKKRKNETIPNVVGYLRNILENKYWIKR